MLNNKEKIAIIGATGMIGRKIIEIIVERNSYSPTKLKLYASNQSAGKQMTLAGHTFHIHSIEENAFTDCSIAVFATDSKVSENLVPIALKAGLKVIDSSSYYRLDPKVPLIVPPVNMNLLQQHKLISVANCLAAPISIILKPLHAYATVKRLLITTFQSTSGAGKGGVDELEAQIINSRQGFNESHIFPRQIAYNIVPQVDDFMDDGSTYEEYKIIHEIKKIICSKIKIGVTACRVPVKVGHSIALAVEFHNQIFLSKILTTLENNPAIQLSQHCYSTPIEIQGKDQVFVGRIRLDPSTENGLLLWLASDNSRRGGALDSVEILEQITACSKQS